MIGTLALVPQVVDAVAVPVLASGGIMDGRGIAAALALGAAGVQMGTAFLACDESGAPQAYKDRLRSASAHDTAITRAFSGRPARGIVNRFMVETDDAQVPPYPYQNALTRDLRREAGRRGAADYLSLWAGQGVPMIRSLPAGALVDALAREARAAALRVARVARGTP